MANDNKLVNLADLKEAFDTLKTNASQSAAGLMSATDKAKLDGIASGAQVNSITGVKGNSESSYRTGNVNITAANIGLGNVENKSSSTIRGELTKANVTTALGYTPPTTDTNTWRPVSDSVSSTSSSDAASSKAVKTAYDLAAATQSDIAIIINGNKTTHTGGAAVGQYVIVRSSSISGITDGLYKVSQAIPANTVITSAYLTAVDGGLGSEVTSLNNKIARFGCGTESNIPVSLEYEGQYYVDAVVAHGLGVTPDVVIVSPFLPNQVPSNYISSVSVAGKDAANFTVRIWAMANTTIDLCWMARAN